MTDRHIDIDFVEYHSIDELDTQDRELVEAALEAQGGSYSPYSHFSVGAALRLADGTIVKGSNQENASYPEGLCAERTAMFAASALHPGAAFDTLAIVGGHDGGLCDEPATPCGACRQVMAEFEKKGGRPLKVILAGVARIYKFSCVSDLLPLIFDSL